MNRIDLITIKKCCNRVTYKFTVSEGLASFFSQNEFWIEYPVRIEDVPDSVAIIPFMTAVLPIIWLSDAQLKVPVVDKEFYQCIPDIKAGYKNMYPEASFQGEIIIGSIEENNMLHSSAKMTACFFSGGVDSVTTMLKHIDEKPILLSIWGSDVRISNEKEWNLVHKTLESIANENSLDLCCIKSTFRDFDKEYLLDKEYRKTLGKGWWYGVKHGIGIIGHAAPLAYLYGIKKLYIASSNCPEDGPRVKCASDPRIDNQVRFCGCKVVHDGFELNRQKKVRYLVEYGKNHPENNIPLHVCWESHTGGNCCRCEKCYRTMAEIWIEGDDPRRYGFDYPDSVFKDMYKFIALKCNNMAKNTWTYGKERLIENWPNIKKTGYGKKIAWIKRFDFHNLEKNWDRKAYKVYRKIKALFKK